MGDMVLPVVTAFIESLYYSSLVGVHPRPQVLRPFNGLLYRRWIKYEDGGAIGGINE
jgi:hypothetical protein